MHYTPDMNDGRTIFVFGSNLEGFHGAGAAREAFLFWGAERGIGEGRQGHAYGIPTKDGYFRTLRLPVIKWYVGRFKAYARSQRHLHFLVTEIGCGLAGYECAQIAPFFAGCPANCTLPDRFIQCLSA
jgi:hypothetical protein